MNNKDLSVNMHKSTTNRSITNQPDSGIVSRSGLGKRVIVNGHYGGVLRYMGQVAGKEGIFCGIELDQPVGKNDGTHEGAFYFGCRPGHGVFAPCHKVQMETMRRQTEKGGKASLIAKAERTLSRSAMPSLNIDRNISEIPSTSTQIPQMPMDWSLMSMSTVSNNSDSSYVIRNHNIDLMANSQATYTVFESDCPMLSDLELSESSLLRLDEEDDDDDRTAIIGWILNENGYPRTFRPDESVILDGPSLGMDLPVITSPEPEDEEDMAETPMAETKNFTNGLINLKSENRQNRSHLKLEGLEQGNKDENKLPNKVMADGKIVVDNACYLRTTNVSNSHNNNANPHREEKASSKEEKKTRTSIFQTIPMATQNHSAAARSKPKQPSKSQMVMEQLKASMEAEKLRAKKEIRSKLVTTPNKGGEKRGDDVGKSKSTTNVTTTRGDAITPSRSAETNASTPTSTLGRRKELAKYPSSDNRMPRTFQRTLTNSNTPSKPLSSGRNVTSRQVLGSKENTTKENPSLKTPTKNSTKIIANLVNKEDIEQKQKLTEQLKVIERLEKELKNEKKMANFFVILCKNFNEKNINAQKQVNKLENLLEQNNSNHELEMQKRGFYCNFISFFFF
uniref:CAP-Gly domain-containing protein n=1 Tax=Meloidogyne enterolobii TaxID=390850 RepID=A0A6V7UE88_MELEN|nr:unnamed protein product [Meloidogyne enterolobii]